MYLIFNKGGKLFLEAPHLTPQLKAEFPSYLFSQNWARGHL